MKQFSGIRFLMTSFATTVALLGAGVTFPAKPGETVVPNQYIVKVVAGAGVAPITKVLPGSNVTALQGDLNVVVTSIPGAIDQLAKQTGVEFVEPDRVRKTSLVAPSDPSYGSQWALQTLQAVQAWSLLPGRYLTSSNAGGARIHVAVLDTGLDCSHPDFINAGGSSSDSALGGQINYALSKGIINSTIAGPCGAWQDDFGHGTGAAGIIGAAAQNGIGIAGVAYPVDLIIFKVMDNTGSGSDSSIAAAIMGAADAGARVISLSLGGSGYAQSLQTAINYAWAHDALVVSAAGNSSSNAIFYPADAAYGVAVSSTNQSNNRSSFSNFGPFIGVAAPGEGITTTFPLYPTPLGSISYGGFSGTSAATPHASAVAGLLALTTPNTSAAAIMQRLQQSAASLNANGAWNQDIGYGIVNAFNAVSGNLRPASWGGIKGQIINNSAFPISDAQVSANGNVLSVDSSGLFHFTNLAPGTYTLTASAGGYPTLSVTANVVTGADTDIDLVLGASYSQFSGVVTDGGAGVSGAIVQALSNGVVQATAVANQSGQYSLWVPKAGVYDLRATQISRQTTTVFGQSTAAGGNTAVNLSLPLLPSVAGTVLDSSSRAVSNAEISLSGAGITAGAVSDSSGKFATIGLPAGAYTVTATASGQPTTTTNAILSVGTLRLTIQMGGSIPPPPVSVSIGPASANLNQGDTQQFTATIQNASNPAVTWSLSPQVGSVDGTGLYRAPATIAVNQNIIITATSVQDLSKSASATITLNAPPSWISSMSVGPSAATVSAGNTQQYIAKINGVPSSAVTWSISPQVGAISATGLYTAPNSVNVTQLITVTAVSTANSSYQSNTILFVLAGSVVTNPISVSVSPATATVTSNGTQLFTALVTNSSNQQVNWSSPTGLGWIGTDGTYHAPSVTTTQTAIIVATSVADSTKSASAMVTVTPLPPPIAVSVSPAAATVISGGTQLFTAQVTNSSNQQVVWSVPSGIGSIGTDGIYHAPSVTAAQTVMIVATSVADSTKSGSAMVTVTPLPPPIAVSVSPATATVISGGTQLFTAQVSNSSNQQVIWSVPSGMGWIGTDGTYHAPSVSTTQTATIIATSVADSSKSGSAVVTVNPAPSPTPTNVGLSMTPNAVFLHRGQTQQFSVTVTGTSNQALSWWISPSRGSVTANGFYTAPVDGQGIELITIVATSLADPSTSTSTVIFVVP